MPPLITNQMILFDQPHGVYISNEPVTGRLGFYLEEAANISDITVNLVGESNIIKKSPTKGSSSRDKGSENVSTLVIMDEKKCLFSADSDTKVEAGEHSLPFSVKLPANIPSSIELPQSYVQYRVVVTARGAPDLFVKFERPFSVNRTCDLNNFPKVKLPVKAYKTGTKFLCIHWNTVAASMDVERCGYVPGEKICVNALVTNNSLRSIYLTKVSLIQKTCVIDMFSNMQKLKCKRIVTESTRGSIPVGATQIWQNEMIEVPSIPPSSASDCFCWSVRYWLQMEITNTTPKTIVRLRIPIIIGNIPIKDFNPHLSIPHPLNSTLDFLRVHRDYFSEEVCSFSSETGEREVIFTPKYFMLKSKPSDDGQGPIDEEICR